MTMLRITWSGIESRCLEAVGGDVNFHKGRVRQVCLCKLPGLAVSFCFKNHMEFMFHESPLCDWFWVSNTWNMGNRAGTVSLSRARTWAFYFTWYLSSKANRELTQRWSQVVSSLPHTEHTRPSAVAFVMEWMAEGQHLWLEVWLGLCTGILPPSLNCIYFCTLSLCLL